MTDSRSGIVPLTGGENFATWKVQCKMTLLKHGLWNIVNGTEGTPSADAGPTIIQKYFDRRDRALSTIVLAVDTKLLYLLGDPYGKNYVTNSRQRHGRINWHFEGSCTV